MKEYKKAKMIAKNLPSGSYAAGCPTNKREWDGNSYCRKCELAG